MQYRKPASAGWRWPRWLGALRRNGASLLFPIAAATAGMLALAWSNGSLSWPAPASFRTTSSIAVVNGDTVRVNGTLTRLVGFNAPEVMEPACDTERRLGQAATNRLRQLVGAGSLTVSDIACSCPPGTEGTPSCNYGRACAVLRSKGRNVGDILIAEGLAVSYACGLTSCPPLPRPWCG